MTLLYYDPVFLEHQTGNHPEQPERLRQVVRHLQWTGLDAMCRRPAWKPLSTKRLQQVHSLDYAERVKSFAEHGGGIFEEDTIVSPRSYEVALWAAGAVCDAVERVITGPDKRALCLVRPPGHHALATGAMGFCLLNNVALGARLAMNEFDLERVLIVDWDVHHGNGTQAIFWEDGRVGFFSLHRWPFYPGTGARDETGSGDGLGSTLNVPIEFGITRDDLKSEFQRQLSRFAQHIAPQLVLISAGFDAHRNDPVGSLGMETEDFIELTQFLLQIADEYAGGSIVSVLEGGYNPAALTDCVDVHLHTLLE